jgi:kynurenine formamidase
MSRIVDLSLLIEDNMPAHKLFQRPMYLEHLTHETSKAQNLGVPGDAMTFQTNFIGMLDHVGTHVDAFRHVNPKGMSVDQMPLDLFMGKAVCFDLQHIPDLGDISVADMETAEAKAGLKVNGHIVLLCTGFHKRNYPSLDSVWKNPLLTVEATRWAPRARLAHAGRRRPVHRQADRQYLRPTSPLSRPRDLALGMAGQSRRVARQGRVPVLRRSAQVQGRLRLSGAHLAVLDD